MAVSKKMKIQREHKKAEAAGTRAPVKANGLPVKAPKEMVICTNCRREMVKSNVKPLEDHAGTHGAMTKEQCFPSVFN
ncbi:hypothetical protein LA080_002342 [Diaporthe eres]|uniref:Uncharacterized protein n=1 Tax=Diaporthe vaccinii TaxID=105482 RepID=A0ABR4FBG9_9PEZI|nr:hypothetical protein LA080_002342 [Diaporthe eres]